MANAYAELRREWDKGKEDTEEQPQQTEETTDENTTEENTNYNEVAGSLKPEFFANDGQLSEETIKSLRK